MAKRKNITSVPDEKNRKEKKARYIGLKNLMRKYPECSYGGDFYCDHIYDPDHPWLWVDFRFFNSKEKRYYAASLRTLDFEAYQDIEDRAIDQSANIYPYPPNSLRRIRTNTDQLRDDLREKLIVDSLDIPKFVSPSIMVKDYGPVAVGLWATVNKPHIDPEGIREFIKFFRYLGEPITPGWLWRGEEVYVVPRRIYEKF